MKLIYLLLIFAIIACHKQVVPGQLGQEKVAREIFGNRYLITKNDSQTHSIISQKRKEFKNLFADVIFVVVDNKTDQILLRDTLDGGKVSWIDDYKIRAKENKKNKTTNKNQKIEYIFDVRTLMREY